MNFPILQAPEGVTARFFGDASQGLGTTRYYWVQAVYAAGYSALSAVGSVATPSGLSKTSSVLVQWQAAPSAIGYFVFGNTTGTFPDAAHTLGFIASSETGFNDVGAPFITGYPISPGLQWGVAVYDFSVDGGAVSAIVPKTNFSFPIGAKFNSAVKGIAYTPAANQLTSGGSATIAISLATGPIAIVAATAFASYEGAGVAIVANTAINTALQPVTVTIATAAITGGILVIMIPYFL